MSISELRALYRKYHMSEQLGIVAALFMAVISYLPLFITWDLQQLAVVGFFLVLFIIRLGLYIWNRSVRGTGKEESSQAKMMLTASILLLIMQSTFMAALFYQLMVRKRAPLMASIKILAIVYGVYAVGKFSVSIYNLIVRRKLNLYYETLSYVGWISAVYTLSLYKLCPDRGQQFRIHLDKIHHALADGVFNHRAGTAHDRKIHTDHVEKYEFEQVTQRVSGCCRAPFSDVP